MSREISSAYEGSLTRSDSRKGRVILNKNHFIAKKMEHLPKTLGLWTEKDLTKPKWTRRRRFCGKKVHQKRKVLYFTKDTKGVRVLAPQQPKRKLRNPAKNFRLFSRAKSPSLQIQKVRTKGLSVKVIFHRRDQRIVLKTAGWNRYRQHNQFLPLRKERYLALVEFFSYSNDSKTTSDEPKKFSVPGKFIANKEPKSGGESSDMEVETGRTHPSVKRRVSLPGMLGFPRSSSTERTSPVPSNAEPSLDPALLKRRRSNFKKAQSLDVQNDPSKNNSMLNKLKFWDLSKKDRSPDSRTSASPEAGRSRSSSPVDFLACKDVPNSREEAKIKIQPVRKSGGRTVKGLSSQETTSTSNKKVSPNLTHSAKEDSSVKTSGKNAKVVYVGPVRNSSPKELSVRKEAQNKVNSENKSRVVPNITKTVAKTPNSDVTKVTETSSESSTRDTVSKLRERRRRRREERERFFAGMDSRSNENNKVGDVEKKDKVQQDSRSTEGLKTDNNDGNKDQIDGEITFDKKDLRGQNDKKVQPTPKLRVIGKMPTVDDVLQNGKKVNFLKLRSQTVASSVHADIISDLIREKGLKSTTTNEVKIPSVAELRTKFMIFKDDAKVTPSRVILKLDERPNSICGEVLSPTEMKKFDDITFSLAKKIFF